MTLSLDTENANLAEQFTTDGDNPSNALRTYLTRIEGSRELYMNGLEPASHQSDCHDQARF